jgi:hypothetical protein
MAVSSVVGRGKAEGEEHMNTCPNCGKVAGLHSSILQGCMCQYSMQAPAQRTWVGLTNDELTDLFYNTNLGQQSAVLQAIALLKQKNGYAEERNT